MKLNLHNIFSKNLALCLHLEINSGRLFSSGPDYARIIRSLSVKQMLHVGRRYEATFFTIAHVNNAIQVCPYINQSIKFYFTRKFKYWSGTAKDQLVT